MVLSSLLLFATSNGAWMANVPQRDRERVNPYRDQPDAVAAGHRVFLDHCAHCHGNDAEGTKKRPSLKSARVQHEATDGDLHWLLVNGNRGQGMPSWVKLGDPQIWQVICYLKSLH
jgi:cytochrome c oxidase cbb3-type subunit 3